MDKKNQALHCKHVQIDNGFKRNLEYLRGVFYIPMTSSYDPNKNDIIGWRILFLNDRIL